MKVSHHWDSLPTFLAALGIVPGERALVIEDEAFVRESLARALVAMGFEVDAREGVERDDLPLTGYALAFLDHFFLSKTLTGALLAPELRASCPAVRIVAMSSDADRNADMLRLGADVAVSKRALRRWFPLEPRRETPDEV